MAAESMGRPTSPQYPSFSRGYDPWFSRDQSVQRQYRYEYEQSRRIDEGRKRESLIDSIDRESRQKHRNEHWMAISDFARNMKRKKSAVLSEFLIAQWSRREGVVLHGHNRQAALGWRRNLLRACRGHWGIEMLLDKIIKHPVFRSLMGEDGIFEVLGGLFGGGDSEAAEVAERERRRIEREKRIADETSEMNNAAVAAREMYLQRTAKRKRKTKNKKVAS